MKWLILSVILSGPFSKEEIKPYKPPPHPIIKFVTKDIWVIHRMSKQCIEMPNASLCASAQSIYPEQVVFVVFKWKF